MITLSGLSQNFTTLQVNKNILTGKSDTTLVISLNSSDALKFRTYWIELEYSSEMNKVNEQKLLVLSNENKELQKISKLWEATSNVNLKQLEKTDAILKEINSIQVEKEIQYNKAIKQSLQEGKKEGKKKGFKIGTIIGAATTIIICLLVK